MNSRERKEGKEEGFQGIVRQRQITGQEARGRRQEITQSDAVMTTRAAGDRPIL